MATKRQKQKREIRYSNAKEVADKQEKGFASTSVKLPDDASFFSFKKAGTYRIDIIPYVVGSGNPDADEGIVHFTRKYHVHRNIGPEENAYVCLAKTFGKKCPICEAMTTLKREGGDEDVIKALKPQLRLLFNVIDLSDRDKGVQVMDTAYFRSFGEMLDDKIRGSDEEDDYSGFHHLDDGLTLKVTVKDASFNGINFRQPTGIEFKPRKQGYDEDTLDQTHCLDDMLIEKGYDELKRIYLQISEDEDDEEEAPPPKKAGGKGKKEPTAKDHGLSKGDKVMYDDIEWEIKRVSPDGTSLTLVDEDDNEEKAISPEDVEKVEEDDDEPAPKAKGKGKTKAQDPAPKAKGKGKTKAQDPDDEDDEDMDEDSDSDVDEDDDFDDDDSEDDEPPKGGATRKKR